MDKTFCDGCGEEIDKGACSYGYFKYHGNVADIPHDFVYCEKCHLLFLAFHKSLKNKKERK